MSDPISQAPFWTWALFATLLAVLLTVDLIVHRGTRLRSRAAAVTWTAVWIGVGLLFTLAHPAGRAFMRERRTPVVRGTKRTREHELTLTRTSWKPTVGGASAHAYFLLKTTVSLPPQRHTARQSEGLGRAWMVAATFVVPAVLPLARAMPCGLSVLMGR
jgi:hypothetical protein